MSFSSARTARLGLHDGGITAIRISTDGHTADVSEPKPEVSAKGN